MFRVSSIAYRFKVVGLNFIHVHFFRFVKIIFVVFNLKPWNIKFVVCWLDIACVFVVRMCICVIHKNLKSISNKLMQCPKSP